MLKFFAANIFVKKEKLYILKKFINSEDQKKLVIGVI
jgi:hypothetical protein